MDMITVGEVKRAMKEFKGMHTPGLLAEMKYLESTMYGDATELTKRGALVERMAIMSILANRKK